MRIGIGIGIGAGFWQPAGFSGALDNLSAAGGYSTRKLRTAYAGSGMRVRRSSDNAEQDIGFTLEGRLDTAALLSFVGAGDGFVTTWYDQSGNARNATQTTAANQPKIATAGVAEPGLIFAGTQQFNVPITLLVYGAAETHIAARISGGLQQVVRNNGVGGTMNRYQVGGSRAVDFGATTTNFPSVSYGADFVGSGRVLGTGVTTQYARSGGTEASAAVTRTGIGTTLIFGAQPGGAEGLVGRIYEIIHFNSILSTDERTALESSMATVLP